MRTCLAVFLLSAFASQAFACRCLEPASTAIAYQNATAVVRAWVDSVEGLGDSPEGAVAHVSVKEAWKAEVSEDIQVSTQTTCAFDFQPSTEYLLFLYPGTKTGQWSTRICVGNQPIEQAAPALDWLRRNANKLDILSPQ